MDAFQCGHCGKVHVFNKRTNTYLVCYGIVKELQEAKEAGKE